jgi:hypothetical protein
MARSLYALVLLVPLGLGSSGCTAIAKMEAPSIRGAPDSTGLVVVETDITVIAAILGIRTQAEPRGGLLVRVDGTEGVVEGSASSGLVIFPDVPPGRWQIAMIAGEWQTGGGSVVNQYQVGPESVGEYTVDVRAGAPIYVGAEIDDDRRLGSAGIRYHRRADAAAEAKAWKWMRDVYEKSAWEPIFGAKAAGG